ncbi:MAG: EamA family transporter [Candidatus Eremiobacteraeota bacterium]|nr:EamA family transporter [Candidatus Eremiobacteraeota bacterium]MCW5869845.1 EamA family transporter [Candidatus Eremiobacteraeota bacterium]
MIWRRSKVVAALFFAICCSSLGDVAISQAMRALHQGHSWLFFLSIGMVGHAIFLAVYLASLSREDMSFVLPLTALDYVLVTIFAVTWAGEEVGSLRWAGTLLVAAGVGLLVRN